MSHLQTQAIDCLRITLEPLENYKLPDELKGFSASNGKAFLHYVIVKIKTNEVIGVINVDKFSEMRNSYNVSYMILEEHRGHNYTVEALVFLLENIYGKKSITDIRSGKVFSPSKLVIVTSIHNAASKQIAKRMGFVLMNRMKVGGKSHNVYLLTKDSYFENQFYYAFMKFDFLEI